MDLPPRYLDLTDLFARKAKGRGARAALSFAEKLAILDMLRDEAAAMRKSGPASGWTQT